MPCGSVSVAVFILCVLFWTVVYFNVAFIIHCLVDCVTIDEERRVLISCRQDMDFSRHEYTSNPTKARRLVFERSQHRFNGQTSKASRFCVNIFKTQFLGLRAFEPDSAKENRSLTGLVERFGRDQHLPQYLLWRMHEVAQIPSSTWSGNSVWHPLVVVAGQ